MKKFIEELRKDKFLIALLVAFLTFCALYVFSWGMVHTVFSKKAILGLKINGVSVSGKTEEEISQLLSERVESFKKEKITVKTDQNQYELAVSELEPEYKVQEVAKRAISFGKNTYDIREFIGGDIVVKPGIKEDVLKGFYEEIAEKENESFKNAEVKIEGAEVIFLKEKEGEGIKEETFQNEISNSLTYFRPAFSIKSEVLKPYITKELLLKNEASIIEFLEKPLTLKSEGFQNRVAKEDLANWVDFAVEGEGYKLSINKKAVENYLKSLKPKIEVSPKNATLSVVNATVQVTDKGMDGKTLDLKKAIKEIGKNGLLAEEIILPVGLISAEISQSNLENLGLKELVASGESDFTGSSESRKHNIRIGSSKFDGILIKPDEVFSFNQYLGEVDATNGYLPELVILQNKTEPQYGGGLCQVSSTAFRVALNAGMPIVARSSHAYPVKYYYPIGADATIYLPSPDLKFKNDTGAYIYVRTNMVGNKLRFDFIGTKQKRTVKFSGNNDGSNAVLKVEDVKPYLYNHDAKGKGSVDSIFYQFIYDETGKMINKYRNLSKYDSPEKYPKPVQTQ